MAAEAIDSAVEARVGGERVTAGPTRERPEAHA